MELLQYILCRGKSRHLERERKNTNETYTSLRQPVKHCPGLSTEGRRMYGVQHTNGVLVVVHIKGGILYSLPNPTYCRLVYII